MMCFLSFFINIIKSILYCIHDKQLKKYFDFHICKPSFENLQEAPSLSQIKLISSRKTYVSKNFPGIIF